MDPRAEAATQLHGLVDRVDRAEPGGAGGHDDRADGAGAQQLLECVEVHASHDVRRDGVSPDAEQVAHPAVGVVGVGAVGDAQAGMQLARHEQRLEVGDRAAAGQVAEVLAEPEHGGELRDDLAFHRGGRRPAVEGMVVRVDQHRGDVAEHRGRVRWLQHLPDVAGVEERVVVPQPGGQLGVGGANGARVDVEGVVRGVGPELRHPSGDLADGESELLAQLGGAGWPAAQDSGSVRVVSGGHGHSSIRVRSGRDGAG